MTRPHTVQRAVGTVLVIVLLVAVTPPATARAPGDPPAPNPPGRPAFVEQELLVAFRPAAGPGEREDVRRRHRLEHVEDLPLPGLERVRMHGPGGPPARADTVARERAVRSAQPNHLWHVDAHGDGRALPDDPGFSALWGLHNDGQAGGVHGADIDYVRARRVAAGSEEVAVGVVDTGVAVDHPDLARNVWLNTGELPPPQQAGGTRCVNHDCDGDGAVTSLDYADDPRIGPGCLVGGDVRPSSLRCAFADGQDTDGNGLADDILGWDFRDGDNDPDDGHGHGTHVAGTLAAVADNGIGVTGASQARIMPLKFMSAGGTGTTADAVKALDYAIRMGARLTNNSWGSASADTALSDKILDAHGHGRLFVAAAGNSGNDVDEPGSHRYPASFGHPNMLTVAATTRADELASSSNYGSASVHLGAPGTSIYSTVPGGEGYAWMSGTSMAAPHVAGAVAEVWGGYPQIGHTAVRGRVIETGDAISALAGRTVSGRRLNLAGALDTDGPPQLTDLAVSHDPLVLGDDDATTLGWSQNEPASIRLRVGAEGTTTALRTETLGGRSAGHHRWVWDGTDDGGADVGSGTYDIEVQATDVAGNTVAEHATVVVEAQAEANLRVRAGHSRDPVAAGEPLTYTARVRNVGPSQAEAVTTRAVLPAELTDVSMSGPASGDCAYHAGRHAVSCAFGALEGGTARRVRISGVVDAATPDGSTLALTYEAASPTRDPHPRLRRVTRTTTIVNEQPTEADLRAWVGHSPRPATAGAELTYDARVRNLGPSVGRRVTTVGELPAAVTAVSLGGPAADHCSYHPARHAVSCAFGDLVDGGVRRLLITGVVDAATPDGTTLAFTYEAASPTPDPQRDLRRFTRTTAVTAE